MINMKENSQNEGLSGLFLETEYVKYYEGDRLCPYHVDAVHASGKGQDLYTGKITEAIMERCKCSGIIATKSRRIADLNRPATFAGTADRIINQAHQQKAIDEYRAMIGLILTNIGSLDKDGHLIRPHLHLALHGMTDTRYGANSIEIGTRHGSSCAPEVRDFVMRSMDEKAKELSLPLQIFVDHELIGDESKTFHRWGDTASNYSGYGPNYHAVQVEISRTLRQHHQEELTEILSTVLEAFAVKFAGA